MGDEIMTNGDWFGHSKFVRADIAAAREAELRAIIGAYQDGTLPDLTAVHMGATLDARREIERLRGLLDEAREGLGYYVDTLCEGFCEDMPDRAYTDQNCELDCSACKARATLAKIGGQND